MRHLLLACLIAATSFAHAEVIDIDNAQLDKLSKSGVPVIDIRLQSEWEETGIVGGSKPRPSASSSRNRPATPRFTTSRPASRAG